MVEELRKRRCDDAARPVVDHEAARRFDDGRPCVLVDASVRVAVQREVGAVGVTTLRDVAVANGGGELCDEIVEGDGVSIKALVENLMALQCPFGDEGDDLTWIEVPSRYCYFYGKFYNLSGIRFSRCHSYKYV